jgi:UDP-N-acetylmuramate dehydrogenase
LGYGDLQKVAQQLAGDGELCAQVVSNAVMQVRQSKLPDPKVLGNVGSFFHNPIVDEVFALDLAKKYANLPFYPYHDKKVKLAAGWLIDQAGLKGHQIGGAAVHTLQALVLVNKGGATFADILALCHYVQEVVFQKFGIHLIPEPNFIPA